MKPDPLLGLNGNVVTDQNWREHLTAFRRRVTQLSSQVGALMVDKDRSVQAALETAGDCTKHGEEIQYLRHMASATHEQAQRLDAVRWSVVTQLITTKDRVDPDGTISGKTLIAWLEELITVLDKAQRKPLKHPTLADCSRMGGCNHDDLDPGLRAELDAAQPVQQLDLLAHTNPEKEG